MEQQFFMINTATAEVIRAADVEDNEDGKGTE